MIENGITWQIDLSSEFNHTFTLTVPSLHWYLLLLLLSCCQIMLLFDNFSFHSKGRVYTSLTLGRRSFNLQYFSCFDIILLPLFVCIDWFISISLIMCYQILMVEGGKRGIFRILELEWRWNTYYAWNGRKICKLALDLIE